MELGWLKARAERNDNCQRALSPVIPIERRTLAQRLGEGPLPLNDGLRLGLELASALRTLHEEGRIHGALTPLLIELTPVGIKLLPGRVQRGVPSPYTPPEVLAGETPDARSDIFSFGAILFEIVMGRWAFEGDTPEALAVALQQQKAPRTDKPGLDPVIANCLAKDRACRWQQIRRAQLELKLALVFARQPEDSSRREQFQALVRSEVQSELESRVAGRLERQQGAIIELRQSMGASAERLSRAERTMEAAERRATEFASTAAVQLHALEQTVRAQASALEDMRRALAQTDDLLERVVEALDCLQSMVLDRSDFVHGEMGRKTNLRAVRPISG